MTATAVRTTVPAAHTDPRPAPAASTTATRRHVSPRPVPRRPVGSRSCGRRPVNETGVGVARADDVRTTRVPAAVYRRRRLVALAAVTFVASVVVILAGRVGHADAELDGPPPAPEVYVVQPGDTLWSIADRVAPDVDRRDVVSQLTDAAGGSDLVPGQRIELPRFFD
jgi:nucleoid-associated protein YgaU